MYENLIETREAADLTRGRIVQLAVNAFDASWLPPEEKRALRSRLDRFVASRSSRRRVAELHDTRDFGASTTWTSLSRQSSGPADRGPASRFATADPADAARSEPAWPEISAAGLGVCSGANGGARCRAHPLRDAPATPSPHRICATDRRRCGAVAARRQVRALQSASRRETTPASSRAPAPPPRRHATPCAMPSRESSAPRSASRRFVASSSSSGTYSPCSITSRSTAACTCAV